MISKGSEKMCCSIAISPENSRAQTILSDTWSATWKRLLTPYCKMSVFPGIYLSVSCFLYVSLFSVQVEYFTGGIKLVLVFGSHHYYIILKKKKKEEEVKKQKEKHASDMEKCKISRSTWNWFMEYVKCPHLVCEKMFPNSLIFFYLPMLSKYRHCIFTCSFSY